MPSIELQYLRDLLAAKGLDLLSIDNGEPLSSDAERLDSWQRSGYAAEMQFMQRPAELLSEPKRLMPNLKSIWVLGLRYASNQTPERPAGYGRVARYAWGLDYHSYSKELLAPVIQEFRTQLGDSFEFRIFSDAVPLLERALARRSGLGFIGKNTLLIRPGVGSFFFLAEILTNLEVSNATPVNTNFRGCSTCTRCLDHCPTGALEPHQLDARKCISYLSIEKRGFLNDWQSKALGEWVFGCDLCQEICPFNHSAQQHFGEVIGIRSSRLLETQNILPGFFPERGVGPLLKLEELLQLRTNSAFKQRYSTSALMRAGRKGLLRNAACVAANTQAEFLRPALLLAAEDSVASVRWHALKAIIEIDQGIKSAEVDCLFQKLRQPNSLLEKDSVPDVLIQELEQKALI